MSTGVVYRGQFSDGSNVTIPNSADVGDLAILFTVSQVALTTPTGWSVLRTDNPTVSGRYFTIYTKTIIAGDRGTSFVLSNNAGASLILYSGVAAGTPVIAASINDTSGTTMTAPAVTTTVPNSVVLSLYGTVSGSGAFTPPSGPTYRVSGNFPTPTLWTYIYESQVATPGTFAAQSASTNTDPNAAYSIVLAPAAAPSPQGRSGSAQSASAISSATSISLPTAALAAPIASPGVNSNTSTNSGTCTAVGDLAVVMLALTNTSAVTAPAGWNLAYADTTNSSLCVRTYTKVLVAGDIGSTPTWTYATAGVATVTSFLVGSVLAGAPVNAVATAAATATGVSTAPAVTSSSGTALWLALFAETGTAAVSNFTPTAVTLLNSSVTAAPGRAVYQQQIGAVSTGTEQVTWAASQTAVHAGSLIIAGPAVAPSAPSVTAPTNTAYTDLAINGGPFTWTYNNTDGSTQQAYAFRRKISGAPAYQYWNAGTGAFQSTEVFNTSASGSLTFPAATWADGNVYQWSVNTQSTAGITGVYAGDSTVTASGPPSVSITAPSGTQVTQTPTVMWSTTVQAGLSESQTAYRIVVESGNYVATPGSGTTQYDSGVVTSSATSAATGALPNGITMRVFMQVTETGGQTSAWAYQTFTIALDAPAAPLLTASWDTAHQRAVIVVQGQDNLLSTNQASLETDTTGWTAGPNTTIGTSTAQALDGLASLSLTAAAAGAVSATTPTGTAGFPVTPGTLYTPLVSFRAAATGRVSTATVSWWQASGAASALRATDTTPAATSTTTGWVQAASVGIVAPRDAAFCSITLTVAGTAGAGEVHYADQIGVLPGSSTVWTRGGLTGLTTVTVQRSIDTGLTWTAVRAAAPGLLPLPASQTLTLYDYEVTPTTTVQYQAFTQAVI